MNSAQKKYSALGVMLLASMLASGAARGDDWSQVGTSYLFVYYMICFFGVQLLVCSILFAYKAITADLKSGLRYLYVLVETLATTVAIISVVAMAFPKASSPVLDVLIALTPAVSWLIFHRVHAKYASGRNRQEKVPLSTIGDGGN